MAGIYFFDVQVFYYLEAGIEGGLVLDYVGGGGFFMVEEGVARKEVVVGGIKPNGTHGMPRDVNGDGI